MWNECYVFVNKELEKSFHADRHKNCPEVTRNKKVTYFLEFSVKRLKQCFVCKIQEDYNG